MTDHKIQSIRSDNKLKSYLGLAKHVLTRFSVCHIDTASAIS